MEIPGDYFMDMFIIDYIIPCRTYKIADFSLREILQSILFFIVKNAGFEINHKDFESCDVSQHCIPLPLR